MRAGLVRVSYECLHQMLGLPANVQISRVIDEYDGQTFDFIVRLVGGALPIVREGEHIPFVDLPRD